MDKPKELEYLPHLKIPKENVEKRPTEFDGGGKSYKRDDYYSHGQSLIKNISSIVQSYINNKDMMKDRYYIEVHLPEKEKLKDRFINLRDNSLIQILDVINESTGYGVIKKQDLVALRERIEEYSNSDEHKGKSYFSFVEEFRPIEYQKKITDSIKNTIEKKPNEIVNVIIESFSSLPKEIINGGFREQLIRFIDQDSESIQDNYIHETGIVVVEAKLKAKTIKSLAQGFNSIRIIEPASQIMLSKIETKPKMSDRIEVGNYTGNALVGIFDSGISLESDLIKSHVHDRFDEVIAHDYDTSHGTFVASRAIFRDDLEEQIKTEGKLKANCKVFDIRIFGVDGTGQEVNLTEGELTRAVRKHVVRNHKDIKVYNLSFGYIDEKTNDTTLSDIQVSRLAAELDNLTKEYNVLFIVSAGNLSNESLFRKLNMYGYPGHFNLDTTRILPPSESFLSLTVGSIVTKSEPNALSVIDHPSPFSRRGPGFNGTRKPDLVADGGNVMYDGSDNPSIQSVAIGGIGGRATILRNIGTSFSAPIIASYAAELFEKFPGASANLVKAMLVHFASIPKGGRGYKRNIYDHLGFGNTSIKNCIQSLDSKATYVHEGRIEQQQYYKIPFWVPSILMNKRNGRKKLKIRITLIWDPLTDRRKGNQYSLIHLNTNLFKIDKHGEKKKIQTNKNSISVDSYKEKFYPVLKIEKEFEQNIGPGLWEFELRMSHRWDIPDGYEQNFALLISVEDPYEKLDVYTEIINEVGVKYPILAQNRI